MTNDFFSTIGKPKKITVFERISDEEYNSLNPKIRNSMYYDNSHWKIKEHVNRIFKNKFAALVIIYKGNYHKVHETKKSRWNFLDESENMNTSPKIKTDFYILYGLKEQLY